MIDFLLNAGSVLAFVALALGIGYGLERRRRRALRIWAEEQGGTFEPGEVELPEAAAFDGPGGEEKPLYTHVARVSTFVLARYYTSWKDARNNRKSSSHVVCFISRPGAAWPSVAVSRAMPNLFGRPEPAKLAVPDATPAFAAAFEVRGDATPEALARLLPRAVQEELLGNETLVSGLGTRGDVARLQAVGQLAGGYPHAKLYEVARRLAAAWK